MADSKESISKAFEKLEKLTKVHKIIICVVTFLLLVGPMGWFVYKPKYENIQVLKKDLAAKEKELAEAKKKAKELDKVLAEFKEAEAQFNIAKKALPESEEIPSLLTNISHSGQDADLEFILFKPEKEKAKGFYAELPVSIKVTGGYHGAALFFEKVAKLNRIVNIKDIKMSKIKKSNKDISDDLDISCKAVTYMFIEQQPTVPAK